MRRCLATRAVRPKDELLRFAIGPDGALVPDVAGRLPGRGLWLVPEARVLRLAVQRNLFAKAAGMGVAVPADLAEVVERALKRRWLDLLGLAARAGRVAAGFDRVREWLAAGRVALLIEASDGAEGGRQKLRAAARELPVIALFDSAELAAALGRERVVHAAVQPGGFARLLAGEARRLAGLCG